MTPDLANDHELNLDSSSAIWLFLYETALLTNIVVECAKNVQNGFPNNMHSLFSVAALWARCWRGPRPGCRPTGSASPRSASRRSCTAGTTSPPPPCMRRTGRTSKVSCEPSVSASQVTAWSVCRPALPLLLLQPRPRHQTVLPGLLPHQPVRKQIQIHELLANRLGIDWTALNYVFCN